MKHFVVYLSLLIFSLFGSSLTSFSLGLWVLEQSKGTITSYSLVWFFQFMPVIFLIPFSGSIIDRCDKKKIILWSQVLAALSSLSLFILFYYNFLLPWHIMIIGAVSSVTTMIIFRTFRVAFVSLVKKSQIIKANGLLNTSFGVVRIAVPILAPVFYKIMGMNTVFCIDAFTFLVCIIVFLQIKFVDIPKSNEKINFSEDLRIIKTYLSRRKSISYLIIFSFISTFCVELVRVLFTPFILDFANEYILSMILSFAASGSVIGGIYITKKKNVSNPVKILTQIGVIKGCLLLLSFIYFNPYSLAISAMLILSLFTVEGVLRNTFLQTTIPLKNLGRISGYIAFLINSAAPIAYLISGIGVDFLSGFLKTHPISVLNHLPGTSVTVAIVLLFIISGLFLLISSILYTKNKPLIRLDSLYNLALQTKT